MEAKENAIVSQRTCLDALVMDAINSFGYGIEKINRDKNENGDASLPTEIINHNERNRKQRETSTVKGKTLPGFLDERGITYLFLHRYY